MCGQSVSFAQFLELESSYDEPIDSSRAANSPRQLWQISDNYGSGTITTVPLVGGAGLVIMEARFDDDIEVFAEQAAQEKLSLTLCLQGSLVSCSDSRADIGIGTNETLFSRFHDTQYGLASRFKAGEQNCFISLQLSEDWLQETNEGLQNEILTDPYWQGVFNSGMASQMMLTTAHEIVETCRQANFSGHLISAKALELWSHQEALLRRLSRPEKPNQCQGLKARDVAAIHQAAAILQSEMRTPPGLQILSRRVGINDNKLKKGFRQVYGTTAFAFLQQYRLQQARDMISSREYNVTQAAEAVGFRSTSHFASVFKQKFGIPPGSL